MMMEQCGYGISGMAIGGYTHVPAEYIDGYPVSPYGGGGGGGGGGSVRERMEDVGQGLYERRALDSRCWDRMSNDSGCKSSSHSNHISIDDPYIQSSLSSAPGRGGGEEHGGRGRGRGQRVAGEGVAVSQLSPDRPPLVVIDAEGDAFDLHPLQPTRTNVDDQYPFVDWRNFTPCPGQYYAVHESKKYGEIGDYGERTVQSVNYLPHEDMYDCPPVAATYPTGLYPGSGGQSLPFCQPSPSGTTVMSDGWQGGSSVTSDETLAVDEAEKRRNPYRAAAAAAALTGEPISSTHRSQGVSRFPSTTSSSLASSRRGSGASHPLRKQGSSHHQRRWHSDLSDTFLDDDERKLRERDRKKKDNHNLIERKRRLNINANIQELGTLLPPSCVSLPKDSTQNKGNILRATVEFVQSAQKKIERLQSTEHRLRDLHATNRQLRNMLKELETFLRAAGLYEDYVKTVGDRDSLIRSPPITFDAVKEEMNFSPTSLQRQESDVTDDCTGG